MDGTPIGTHFGKEKQSALSSFYFYWPISFLFVPVVYRPHFTSLPHPAHRKHNSFLDQCIHTPSFPGKLPPYNSKNECEAPPVI
jgi:hypothetical protein